MAPLPPPSPSLTPLPPFPPQAVCLICHVQPGGEERQVPSGQDVAAETLGEGGIRRGDGEMRPLRGRSRLQMPPCQFLHGSPCCPSVSPWV